jgi:hypothetical protein
VRSLIDLQKRLDLIGLDYDIMFNIGTLIGNQREKITDAAIDGDYTHLLFLDSDMTFDSDIVERFLGHPDKDIVCATYITRTHPRKTVSYKKIGDWLNPVRENESGVFKIEGSGMGCCMIKINTLKKIKKPRFPITWTPDSNDYLGEDMNFFLKVKDEEIDVWCDMDISRSIGHIGTHRFALKSEKEG